VSNEELDQQIAEDAVADERRWVLNELPAHARIDHRSFRGEGGLYGWRMAANLTTVE
jgi:hypothetical protein